MLAEMIQKVAELSAAGVKHAPNVTRHPTDPDQVMILTDDGQVEFRQAPRAAPERQHVVHSFKDFLSAFVKYGCLADPADDSKPILAQAVIWHDARRVVFFTDDPYRRSQVALYLVYSHVWLKIRDLADGLVIDHKGLVRLLRHDFADCVPADVLEAFRHINFEEINRASANVQHGLSKLDADVVAQVTGVRKPDGFTVSCNVLSMAEVEVPVQIGVTLDIDVAQKRFTLQTIPDAQTLAEERMREMVAQTLENHLALRGVEGATVIAGTP
jgi:hypothetical protein